MSVTIFIPTPLRHLVGNQPSLEVNAGSVGDALDELTSRHVQLRKHLFHEEGRLRNFVNVYVNDEDVRYLNGAETPLEDGDRLSIVPSIAGGNSVPAPNGSELSADEVRRYSRHLIMPEVGKKGQEKLKASRVLCIGAGGLGSPATMYLAAAGVGRLGIVDFDVVDESNLQRQILHTTDRVGQSKLESAAKTLEAVNPLVQLELLDARLNSGNAVDIFRRYDVVVDGTDNFPTRYLVNDACVLTGKSNVYASIFRFEGQASVFGHPEGPCYRCLYAEPPPPGLVPSCAEGGVLGVLPGLLGVIQATETIKLILGIGEPLIGRLLLVDALTMQFRQLKLRKNPECLVCGEQPSIHEPIDYELFCGIPGATSRSDREIREISALELKALLDSGSEITLLDVRNPQEYEICRIDGAKLIPLSQLIDRVSELDSAREIVVHCRSGVRSRRAIEQLQQAGFRKLRNLKGGILEWAESVDRSLVKY